MASIEKSIEVDVPLRTAYDQWTQFEEFPQFMEGVKSVRQLDDKRLEWVAEIFGKDVTWNAEITQQIPDQRITWKATSGAWNAGAVSFTPTTEPTLSSRPGSPTAMLAGRLQRTEMIALLDATVAVI